MNSTDSLSISVVIPTYNRKDSLHLTLEGLGHQEYADTPFEVIVVSDGSTDGTNEVLEQRASHSVDTPYRLRSIIQSNAGPARARNRGIAEASGEVIVFLDDDVEPMPSFLMAHAAHHKRDPQAVVIGPMSPDAKRAREEPPWIAWEHAMLQKQYHNFLTGVWPSAGPHHFYSGNASVRRSHLDAVGGFDESFTRQEDVELAVRLERERGLHFLFEPLADGLHRPSRTFTSWLNVPYAYGRLDVVRARRGDASWDVVRHGYRARSLPTRWLASLAFAVPPLAQPSRALLLTAAQATYRAGLPRAALGALSVIYNTRYLEGACAELGTRRALQTLIAGGIPAEEVLPPRGETRNN